MRCATVLFITENKTINTNLQQLLAADNINTDYFPSSSQTLSQLFTVQPYLILLDCGEESVNELTLCQKIRNLYSGPLVLLSRQEKEQFILLALKLGADISLSAQNSTVITAANIKSLLQRFGSFSSLALQFGELTIDSRKRDAFLFGDRVNLSTIEFELLWLLSRKAGQVVYREKIHRELYRTSYNGYDRNIDLYVSRIRQKIGDDPVSPKYLKTVRGAGYQFIGVQNSEINS